jgi:hypothetical protein
MTATPSSSAADPIVARVLWAVMCARHDGLAPAEERLAQDRPGRLRSHVGTVQPGSSQAM